VFCECGDFGTYFPASVDAMSTDSQTMTHFRRWSTICGTSN
jgi:hypothetical protein